MRVIKLYTVDQNMYQILGKILNYIIFTGLGEQLYTEVKMLILFTRPELFGAISYSYGCLELQLYNVFI